MANGKYVAGGVIGAVALWAIGAAVAGFIAGYAVTKGVQFAGGVPLTSTSASAMRVGDAINPRFRHYAVPGGYGMGSHPNLL
jgi:hypothetical protein